MEEELEVIYKGFVNVKNGFKVVFGKFYLIVMYIVYKLNDYFDEEINILLNWVVKIWGVCIKIFGKELFFNILEIDMIFGVKY